MKTDAERIALLESENLALRKKQNWWDQADRVIMVEQMISHGIQFGAYRVRDIQTNEYGPLQFHFTYNNYVAAVMGESAARLFCTLVTKALERQKQEAASNNAPPG